MTFCCYNTSSFISVLLVQRRVFWQSGSYIIVSFHGEFGVAFTIASTFYHVASMSQCNYTEQCSYTGHVFLAIVINFTQVMVTYIG